MKRLLTGNFTCLLFRRGSVVKDIHTQTAGMFALTETVAVTIACDSSIERL